MTETATAPTSIRLPKEVVAEIRELAREEHRTMSNYLSKIILDFMKARKEARGCHRKR